MTSTVLAFLFGVIVFAVWPDQSERAQLARWVRERCESPRDGIARTTPKSLPNVWADLDTAEKEQ